MSTHNPQSVHIVVIYRNPRNSLIRDTFFIFRLHLYVVKLHEVTHNIKRYFTLCFANRTAYFSWHASNELLQLTCQIWPYLQTQRI